MKFTTWNVGNAAGERARAAGGILQDHGTDIALLQEVNRRSFDALMRAGEFEWGVHVGDVLGPMLTGIGRGAARCVAIAGRNSKLISSAPFPDLHLPEKVFAAWVEVAGQQVTLLDYHAPTGDHGHLKPDQAVRVATWLARLSGLVVMGGDFNTPHLDPRDRMGIRTHWHTGDPHMGSLRGDDALVGANPIHGLVDTYRKFLAASPEHLTELPDDGPLATTIVVADGPKRYDQIWASEEFQVRDVVHDGPVFVGNATRRWRFDHALVSADLDVSVLT